MIRTKTNDIIIKHGRRILKKYLVSNTKKITDLSMNNRTKFGRSLVNDNNRISTFYSHGAVFTGGLDERERQDKELLKRLYNI